MKNKKVKISKLRKNQINDKENSCPLKIQKIQMLIQEVKEDKEENKHRFLKDFNNNEKILILLIKIVKLLLIIKIILLKKPTKLIMITMDQLNNKIILQKLKRYQ